MSPSESSGLLTRSLHVSALVRVQVVVVRVTLRVLRLVSDNSLVRPLSDGLVAASSISCRLHVGVVCIVLACHVQQ